MSIAPIDAKTKEKFEKRDLNQSKNNNGKHSKLIFNEKSFFTQINDDLIKYITHEDNFSLITILNFSLKLRNESKIKKIEGLNRVINLEELNLSYQLIQKIEGINHLSRLKDLNLAENNIKTIENLENLHQLEKLNLNGNIITFIPESIKYLPKLNTFKISRNKLDSLDSIINLQYIVSLRNVTLSENPFYKNITHNDLCDYLNDQIETIDSKKVIKKEPKKCIEMHNQLDNQKESQQSSFEIKHSDGSQSLRELNKQLISAKTKIVEENQIIKNKIDKLEFELKKKNDIIYEYQYELGLKNERIAELEKELLQFKINNFDQKLQSNFNHQTINQSIPKPNDEIMRFSKLILDLNQEKKILISEFENIHGQKQKIQSDLYDKQSWLADHEEKLQILMLESKEIAKRQNNELLVPEKTEEKGEVEPIQAHSRIERLKKELEESQMKISKTTNKISNTTRLLEALDLQADKDDILLVQNKLLKLKNKLSVLEQSNNEITRVLSNINQMQEVMIPAHNAKIDKLTREDYLSEKTDNSKNCNKETIENTIKAIESNKKAISDLTKNLQKKDFELNLISRQLELLTQRIIETEKERDMIQRAYQPIFESVYTQTDSDLENNRILLGLDYNTNAKQIQEMILKPSAQYIITLIKTMKSIYDIHNTKRDIKDSKYEMKSGLMDDLIYDLEDGDLDSMKINSILERLISQNESFNTKFGNYINNCIREDQSYELKLKLVEDRIIEKKKLENDLSEEIKSKEKMLKNVTLDMVKNKEQLNSVYEGLRLLYKQIITNKKKLKLLCENDLNLEDIMNFGESSIEETDNILMKVEKINKFLNDLLDVLQEKFKKLDEFNTTKEIFIQEYEKETRELAAKWKELEIRKTEFKTRLCNEMDEHKKMIKDEADRLEREREIWLEEKRRMGEEKSNIIEQFNTALKEKDLIENEIKKEREQQSIIKFSFENQIISLEKKLEMTKKEIQDQKFTTDKLTQEYMEMKRLIEAESIKHKVIKDQTNELNSSYNTLYLEYESLQSKIQKLYKEQKNLEENNLNLQDKIHELEENLQAKILLLERYDVDEQSYKKKIENLKIEVDIKKQILEELDNKTAILSEEVASKKEDLANMHALIEEFALEKQIYMKKKLEHSQLQKQIEEDHARLEEKKYKTDLQEELLVEIKKQYNANLNLLKEKQGELYDIEKKLNKSLEQLTEMEIGYEKYNDLINAKKDELSTINLLKIEKLKEIEKYTQNSLEYDELIKDKQNKLSMLNDEYNKKLEDLNELNMIINKNHIMNEKDLKVNQDMLNQLMKDIEAKEELYNELIRQMDQISNNKVEFEERIGFMNKEIKINEELLKKLLIQIDNTKNELNKLSNNIIKLTDQETNLEYTVSRLQDDEKILNMKCNEIKLDIEELIKLKEEIEENIEELRIKEDSIFLLMAFNGEKVSEKVQKKIKDIVKNHIEIKQMKKTIEKINTDYQNLVQQFNKYTISGDEKLLDFNNSAISNQENEIIYPETIPPCEDSEQILTNENKLACPPRNIIRIGNEDDLNKDNNTQLEENKFHSIVQNEDFQKLFHQIEEAKREICTLENKLIRPIMESQTVNDNNIDQHKEFIKIRDLSID